MYKLFSDASIKAIGAVAYLKVVQEDGKVEVGFILGKAKLAPQSEPIIPRLELCAAVLAAEMADFIQEELDLKVDAVKFYIDSKVFSGTSVMRRDASTCMFTTESSASRQKKTPQTMLQGLCLRLILHKVLGSLGTTSCFSHPQKPVRSLSLLAPKMTLTSDPRFKLISLT